MSALLVAHLVPVAYISGSALYAKANLSQRGHSREAKVAAIRSLDRLYTHYACSARNLREGRTYTLASSALMHGSAAHLIFNSWSFWSFGEAWMGLASKFLLLPVFWGGVVAGNATSLVLEGRAAPNARSRTSGDVSHIGMSGGVMSLGGAVAAVRPRLRVTVMFIPMPMWAFTGLFATLSVFAETNGFLSGIGHMGHLGGLAFGLSTGLLMRGRILNRPF